MIFLITLLGELKSLGQGYYGMTEALMYVALRLPTEIYQFSPMLILLGCILGLSMLSAHRELAVIRAAGFSIRQLIYSIFIAAFLLISVITIVGEWIAPPLSYHAAIQKENAENNGQTVVTGAGVWYHLDNNFIHINQVIGRELLEGVTRYEFDDQQHLSSAYFAKSLIMQNGKWMLNDVVQTQFLNERTLYHYFPQTEWNFKLNPSLLNIGLVEPREMSLAKLSQLTHYLKKNGLQSSEYQFEFWQRVLQPMAALIMILFAIPFVLGSFSATTLGWRMLVGILIGFVFYILNALLAQLCIVFQFPPAVAAILPIFIFGTLWLILYYRLV